MPRGDWTPEQIVLALCEKGLTLTELLQQIGMTDLDIAELEQAISQTLNIPLEELWPSWHKKNNERD